MRTINPRPTDKEYIFKAKVLLGDYTYSIGQRGKYNWKK